MAREILSYTCFATCPNRPKAHEWVGVCDAAEKLKQSQQTGRVLLEGLASCPGPTNPADEQDPELRNCEVTFEMPMIVQPDSEEPALEGVPEPPVFDRKFHTRIGSL